MGVEMEAVMVLNERRLVIVNGRASGTRNIALRALAAIGSDHIGVTISQASSQYQVCFAVGAESVERAIEVLRREFASDHKTVQIEAGPEVAIVAVVGQRLRRTPGIAGRVFSALGREEINVVALIHGASESNVTLLVEAPFVTRALNCLHQEFELESARQRSS